MSSHDSASTADIPLDPSLLNNDYSCSLVPAVISPAWVNNEGNAVQGRSATFVDKSGPSSLQQDTQSVHEQMQ